MPGRIHNFYKILTQTELRGLLHYDPDTGIFTWKETRNQHAKAGDIAGGFQDESGYLRIKINGKKYRSDRSAWLDAHRSWPANEIDHINRNRSDNRLSNLRDVTPSEHDEIHRDDPSSRFFTS